MARLKHGFCTRHRIAYNRDLDASCPQCLLSGQDYEQLDFDPEAVQVKTSTVGAPVDAAGKLAKLD